MFKLFLDELGAEGRHRRMSGRAGGRVWRRRATRPCHRGRGWPTANQPFTAPMVKSAMKRWRRRLKTKAIGSATTTTAACNDCQ